MATAPNLADGPDYIAFRIPEGRGALTVVAEVQPQDLGGCSWAVWSYHAERQFEAVPVNHAVLSAHLDAENYVTKGEQYIGSLRKIIEVLARSGSDATDTESLLPQVEAVQEMYVSHRDWLHVELKPTALIYRGPS